ncbi:MAG: hypothetical protein ABFD60_01615 [Bryobacteraceae bacterium]
MSDAEFMADLADLFNRSVTIEPVTGRSLSGSPVYGVPVPYAARIIIKPTAIRTLDGTVIVGRGYVDLLTVNGIGVTDRITLPAAFPPVQPTILSARPVDGEEGPMYTQLIIG